MGETRRFCAVLLVALGVIASGLLVYPNAAAETPRMGGYVDQVVFQSQGDPNQAMIQLANGEMDLYTFPLRSAAQIQSAQSNPALRVTASAGTEDNLFVNPVPINQDLAPGQFNPFAVPKVREALNYILDRDYLAEGLIGPGFIPHVAPWNSHTPEYSRDPVFFTELERHYAYNLALGRDMIGAGLEAAGAYYESGRWYWQGAPIEINFIVRIEDVRLQIGYYVRDVLESIGFQVNMVVVTGAAAFATVYSGPADSGAWQLYTEGWAYPAFDAWSDWTLDYYYNGGEGSAMWYTVGGPYRPDWELSDATNRLLYGEYGDVAERQQLIERGTVLGVQDSVRVWLISGAFQIASTRVSDYAYDLAGGTWSPFTTRTARFGEAPGGTLRVGTRINFISPWNPWLGGAWLYDEVITQSFTDQGVVLNPHTSEPMPLRTSFAVTTDGPANPQAVPGDAIRYDVGTNEWLPVDAGTTAVSMVEYTYALGNWHDGGPMTMDDIQYEMSLLFRRTTGDVSFHDADAASASDRAFASSFRGMRIVDSDTLDVYTDLWHIDPAMIADQASVFPKTPWEVSELAVATVLADETRISDVTASYDGLDPLDLVQGNSLGFLDARLPAMQAANERPPGAGYITESEASARWSALSAWRATYGHYYVSNGPFFLSGIDLVSMTATVRNFPSYVFPAGHLDAFLRPEIPDVTVGALPDVTAGSTASLGVTTSLSGTPYDSVKLRYAIIGGPTHALVLQGEATHVEPGSWIVTLSESETSLLTPGSYTLEAIASGLEASVTVSAVGAFRVVSGVDTAPPVTSFENPGTWWYDGGDVPFTLSVLAYDAGSDVAQVELFYTYLDPWSGWTSAASLGATYGPYEWTVDPSSLRGDGSYRFIALGTDLNGNTEDLASKLIAGYLELGVDTRAPTSAIDLPLSTSWNTVPITVPVTASDATAGIAAVELYASFSADGTTWSSRSLAGTIYPPTTTFEFVAPWGDGMYRLWTVATDVAGNREDIDAKPVVGDAQLTVDRVAPTVVGVSPSDGATKVSPWGTTIRVAFNESVETLVAEGAFQIMPFVPGTFTWEGNTLVFTPAGPLARGTTYIVRITTAVMDLAGNHLAQDFVFSFTTAHRKTKSAALAL